LKDVIRAHCAQAVANKFEEYVDDATQAPGGKDTPKRYTLFGDRKVRDKDFQELDKLQAEQILDNKDNFL
jgi:hypothetical protein